MHFFLSAALLLVIRLDYVAPTSFFDNLDESYTFDDFVAEFGKSYTIKELARRKDIFEKNLRYILKHNRKGDKGYILGINQFTDLEKHELPRGYDKSLHSAWNGAVMLGGDERIATHQLELPFVIDDPSDLPESVDWRSHGVVTPVKSQGFCGSCWAFASTTVLESHLALETGVLYTLAVQELVSCVDNPRSCGGDGGCSGATGYLAMDFVASSGIQEEWQMGYTSFSGESQPNCTLKEHSLRGSTGRPLRGKPVATIDGYSVVPSNNYKATMNALAKTGPLVVAVACDNWGHYKGGVFTDDILDRHSFEINHAVVLMGYGTDDETGEDYWLVQNSWGPRWGENGYIRLKRVDPETLEDPDVDCGMDVTPRTGEGCTKDKDGHTITPPAVKVCGTSGILFDPVLPIGGKLV
jgi:cathepsin L